MRARAHTHTHIYMHTQLSFHLVTINSTKFPRILLKFSSLECESKSKITPKGNEYLKYQLTIKFILIVVSGNKFTMVKFKKKKLPKLEYV